MINPVIQKAIQACNNSQTELALKIGVAPSFVAQMLNGGRPVPVKRCLLIEKATDGAVTRKELRPDDWQEYWPDVAA